MKIDKQQSIKWMTASAEACGRSLECCSQYTLDHSINIDELDDAKRSGDIPSPPEYKQTIYPVVMRTFGNAYAINTQHVYDYYLYVLLDLIIVCCYHDITYLQF